MEKDSKLPFLDILVKRNDKKVQFSISRKATNTNHFIASDSFHCGEHKKSAFNSMAHRLYN